MARIVHTINSACDFSLTKIGSEVRIRIRETDEEVLTPCDFEIEGDAKAIREILSMVADLLGNLLLDQVDNNIN